MQNPAKLRKRLPTLNWFSLSKYADVESFGPTDWYCHLALRERCAAHFGLFRSLYSEQTVDAKDTAHTVLKALRRTPTKLPNSYLLANGCAVPLPGMPNLQRSPSDVGVRSMTLEELFRLEKRLPQDFEHDVPGEKRKKLKRHVGQGLGALLARGPVREDWMGDPLSKHVSMWNRDGAAGIAIVDLALSDTTLVKHFKRWLAEVREPISEGKTGRHNGPSYTEWAEMGLLPCLDLLIWSTEYGCPLTAVKVATLICGASENVRKTLVPLANAILNGTPKGTSILHKLKVEAAECGAQRQFSKRPKSGRK